MASDSKRILIGFDGSSQSLYTAEYISEIMPVDKTRVVLMNVDTDIMDVFSDINEKPDADDLEQEACLEWLFLRRRKMQSSMDRAVEIFTGKGFSPDHVEAFSREISIGVSRDLIEESKNGYDMVVVGKTGKRTGPEGPVGSVASKLVTSVFHIPVVVVSGTPDARKILAGFDNSKGAIDAIQKMTAFINNTQSITLCHVIRSMGMDDDGDGSNNHRGYNELESRRVVNQKKKMTEALARQKEWLIKNGISKKSIQTVIIDNQVSRSKAIIEKAHKDGYGSIVLGRRGHSAVMEFFMGRVGHKVVQMFDSTAVWVMR